MIEDKKREEAAHLLALRRFARGIGVPEDAAMETYHRELAVLSIGARVTRFVAIIAERRTKDALLASASIAGALLNGAAANGGQRKPSTEWRPAQREAEHAV